MSSDTSGNWQWNVEMTKYREISWKQLWMSNAHGQKLYYYLQYMNFIVWGGYPGLNLIRKYWESEKCNGWKDIMEDTKSVIRVVETLGNLQSGLDYLIWHPEIVTIAHYFFCSPSYAFLSYHIQSTVRAPLTVFLLSCLIFIIPKFSIQFQNILFGIFHCITNPSIAFIYLLFSWSYFSW